MFYLQLVESSYVEPTDMEGPLDYVSTIIKKKIVLAFFPQEFTDKTTV